MANLIGYFPEYFEHLAGPLYDGADVPQPGAPWNEEIAIRPTEAMDPVRPSPAPWLDSVPYLVSDDAVTTSIEVVLDAGELLDAAAIELAPDGDLLEHWIRPKPKKRRLPLPPDAIAVYRPWHLYGEDWGILIGEEPLTLFAAGLSDLTGAPLGQRV